MGPIARISAGLDRVSSIWTIILITALYGYFIGNIMPAESAASSVYAGEWGPPDRHFFYTPDELYSSISQWSEEGRAAYIKFRLSLDIVWAIAYSGFLVTITSVCLRRAFPDGDRRRLLNVICIVPGLLDLSENFLGITLVANVGQPMHALAWLTAGATAAKWSILVFAHFVMLFAIGAAIWARFSKSPGL